jgi:uncharacterized protein
VKRGIALPAVLLGLLLLPSAAALQGHIPLLALLENSTGLSGSVADLELRTTEGDRRVFLETIPLTRIATQISMRFAQQVACRELELDCAGKDFLYTIKSTPGIIGGPSAGAASAVLTSAILLNLTLRNDTVITGTINSGGLVGPVGGLRYKLEAAAAKGYTRALIPAGEAKLVSDGLNTSIEEHARQLGLELHEVGLLDEALEHFTGFRPPRQEGEIVIAPRYQGIMDGVREELCGRAGTLFRQAETLGVNASLLNFTQTLLARSANTTRDGADYAAASYCFRTGVLLRQEVYLRQGLSPQELATLIASLDARRKRADELADTQPLATMTDLQTYMAVKERLAEGAESLADAAVALNASDIEQATLTTAYAEERIFSAESWSAFFNGKDAPLAIDAERLRLGCSQRISEAEERLAYVELELPVGLAEVQADIKRAERDLEEGRYVTCLGTASIAKARADLVLGLAGVDEAGLESLVRLKLDAARRSLLKTLRQGIFPMLAYSYYEYASTLQGFDDQFALLFAEYALELSNLDIYLGAPVAVAPEPPLRQKQPLQALLGLAVLALFALCAGLVLWLLQRKRGRKARKRRR